jgi:predicted alpha-1,2-mannosidase
MKKIFYIVFAIILILSANNHSQNLTKYVNPFIGTGGHGHTFPGATLPFGMVQLSPDTDIQGWDWCSGYHTSDSSIMGFSHTHLSGTGGADYGDILLMPTVGKLQFSPGNKKNPDEVYRSRFSHDKEKASPGYYSVFLEDYNILVELTASARAGLHKYTFPKSDSANIIVDLNHGINDKTTEAFLSFTGKNQIKGFRRSTGWAVDQYVFFVIEFSKPFKTYGISYNRNVNVMRKSARGTNLKGYACFNTNENESILIKVGISAVSIEGAEANLSAEIPGWDFESVRLNADKTWEEELKKIIVEGGSEEQKTIFYTSLYHCMIHPNIFFDVDGSYRGMDNKIHKADNTGYYTLFSLWDTYRALHPLLTIIEPERDEKFVKSIIEKYKESGILPVWELASNETGTMIGYHSVPVIFDAYMKGLRNFDVETAYKAMKHSAEMDHLGLKSYKKFGYVISGLGGKGSLSKTLEYAYDDWCIAMMAKELNKDDDYKEFSRRAMNYKNVFNSSHGFMQPRKEDGNWTSYFNPYEVTKDYTEANAWQYSFYVPQDVKGLIDLHSGNERLIKMLDKMYTDNTNLDGIEQPDVSGLIGQYAHGNEPSHHMAYLYNFTGEPWKTQNIVHKILNNMYSTNRDGISGNEDCGQMSAWYVLSAMGFYSFCPGTNEYLIGTPVFPKIIVNNQNGKKFIIRADNVSNSNYYIQSASLNGKQYSKNYFLHSDITNGSEFVFEMGEKPNKEWGTKKDDIPYSFTKKDFVSPPFQKKDISLFKDSAVVDLDCSVKDAVIYYTLNGTEPNQNSEKFLKPFTIKTTTILKARSYKENLEPSNILSFTSEKLIYRKSEHPENLVNGIRYLYYEGVFSSVFDFTKLTPVKSGIIDYFSFDPANVEDRYGFKYESYIKIPKEGIYRFYLNSDDGSVLFIGDKMIVSNDGRHAPIESFGEVPLKAGFQPITVLFFEDKNGQELEISYEGPGIDKQIIPPNILYYSKE